MFHLCNDFQYVARGLCVGAHCNGLYLLSAAPELPAQLFDVIIDHSAAAEIVCALDCGDRITAVGKYCDYPQMLSELPQAGSAANPDIEKLIALSPQIVITESPIARKDITDLKDEGIQVLILSSPADYDGLYNEYRSIAAVFYGNSLADEIAGKVLALWLPVMLFIICGFEHCIANMYFIPAGMLTSAVYGLPADGLSLFGFFVTNLIPVTIGNIIGGAVCVGAMYYTIYLKK